MIENKYLTEEEIFEENINKITKEEKKDYYFTSTLDNLNEKIKYVIALDTDTKLVLNSCLNLG